MTELVTTKNLLTIYHTSGDSQDSANNIAWLFVLIVYQNYDFPKKKKKRNNIIQFLSRISLHRINNIRTRLETRGRGKTAGSEEINVPQSAMLHCLSVARESQ